MALNPVCQHIRLSGFNNTLSICLALTQITQQKAEKKNLNFCDTRSKAENGVYECRIQPEKKTDNANDKKNAGTNKNAKRKTRQNSVEFGNFDRQEIAVDYINVGVM